VVVRVVLLIISLTAGGDMVLAQDVVQFGNGNRLAGEVKGLERGKLSFETDPTGTIDIEWEDVSYLTSSQRFEVWVDSGERYFGSLVASEQPETVNIDSGQGMLVLPIGRVVLLTGIEQTFLEGLDAELRAGYSFSKASDITQLSLGWDVAQRRERRIAQASFDTDLSDSEDSESSRRANLDLRYLRLLPERWVLGGIALFESNDELSLDLRSSIGSVGGRILRQTNTSQIGLLGGLLFTKEETQFQGLPDNGDSSVEGLLAVDLSWFRFDTPELDVTTRLMLFPNLSDPGRFRTTFDIDFRWEAFTDMFWALTFYHTHNSDPPGEGTQSDYGVTTSLGWDF